MNKLPLITVILPVYNGMKYLKESIDSVLNQTQNEFEFLICDDASTDGSYNYLQSLTNEKIRLFKNPQNQGLFKTLNFLIQQSRSELIHLWSQDDVMYPNCLSEVIKFHQQNPDIAFSYSQRDTFDVNNHLKTNDLEDTTSSLVSPELHAVISVLWGCIAGNISTVTLLKSVVEQAGGFDETMKFSGDFDLWCRITKKENLGFINQKLLILRDHFDQLSRNPTVSIYNIKENIPILHEFLNRIRPEFRSKVQKSLGWRTHIYFFNVFLGLLKHRQFQTAKNYYKELSKIDFIPFLVFKWLIVRIIRVLNYEEKFYKFLIYRHIDFSKLNEK